MRRARKPDPDAPLLGAAETAVLLGWDPRKVAVYASRGVLPAPLTWLAAGPVWRREDILAYRLRTQPERRTAAPAEAAPAPALRVRFVSPHRGLVVFGGPRGPARFRNGIYETSDPAEIAWLRRLAAHSGDFREEPPMGRPLPLTRTAEPF